MFVLADTPVLIWLYAQHIESIPAYTRDYLNTNHVTIPQAARLELQYMYEAKRVPCDSNEICDALMDTIGAQLSDVNMADLITASLGFSWAKDPFDRLIAAEAKTLDKLLVTPEETILRNLNRHAFWREKITA